MPRDRAPTTWGRMTMSSCLRPEHEFAEHTGEERLVIRSPTLGSLFAEAGRALAELEGVSGPPASDAPCRVIEVTATDQASLLVEWLNELIFLAEHERWVPTEFQAELATQTKLRMRARGRVLPEAPSQVKAATHHDLKVDSHDGAFEAQVVLDV